MATKRKNEDGFYLGKNKAGNSSWMKIDKLKKPIVNKNRFLENLLKKDDSLLRSEIVNEQETHKYIENIISQGFLDSCGGFNDFPPVWEQSGRAFISKVIDSFEEYGFYIDKSSNEGVLPNYFKMLSGYNGVIENKNNSKYVDLVFVVNSEGNELDFKEERFDEYVEHSKSWIPSQKTKDATTMRMTSLLNEMDFDVIESQVSGWSSSGLNQLYCVSTVKRW